MDSSILFGDFEDVCYFFNVMKNMGNPNATMKPRKFFKRLFCWFHKIPIGCLVSPIVLRSFASGLLLRFKAYLENCTT